MSAELWRYLAWASVVALGATLAIVDRRVLGRWLFGLLLVAAIAVGMLVTVVSPFRFGGTSYAYPPLSASFSSRYGIGGVRVAAQARRGIMAARS